MSDHVVNDQNEASNIQRNDEPRFTPWFDDTLHKLGRRFALTESCFSFLDIAVSVGMGLRSHVKIMLRNRSEYKTYQIILRHETWIAFIKKRKDVEQFLQEPIGSSLKICDDLVLELVELPDDETSKLFPAVKLIGHGYIHVVPDTLQYLFEIEKSVEDEYSELCQYTDSVNEKYKHFVNNIKSGDITEYEAIKIIEQDFDKNSDNTVLIDRIYSTKFVKFYAWNNSKNRNMH